LLLYVSNHATSHVGFAQEIWQSSLGKLCFQNGWYEFASGLLHPYGSPGTPHTLFMIPRDYTPSTPTADGWRFWVGVISVFIPPTARSTPSIYRSGPAARH
jgi:hypothetical protein